MMYKIIKTGEPDQYKIELIAKGFGIYEPMVTWDHDKIRKKIKTMKVGDFYTVEI